MRPHAFPLVVAATIGACAGPRNAPALREPTPIAATEVAPAPLETARGVIADAPFRHSPPTAGAVTPVPTAPVTVTRLRNGIPVIVAKQPSRFVALRIISASGAETTLQAEHIDCLTDVLRDDTKTRTFAQIHEELASFMMPEPLIERLTDGRMQLSAATLAEKASAGIDLLADILLHPSFNEQNFARRRNQFANFREQQIDDPVLVSEHVIRRALFGKQHPYGLENLAPREIRTFKVAEVAATHARLLNATQVAIVVAGGVSEPDVLPMLERAFGNLPRGPESRTVTVKPWDGPRIVVVDKPGSTLVRVASGFIGPSPRSSDFEATEVALGALADPAGRARTLVDEILAGSITSKTYSYPNASAMIWLMPVRPDAVGRTLRELDHLLVNLTEQGLSEEELSLARTRGAAAIAASFATASQAADEYALLWRMGLPVDDVAKAVARYSFLDLASVRSAGARWLDTRKMRVVLVGDWDAVRDPVTSLDWGPVEVHGRDGKVRIEGPIRASH